jgi:hypothetical protein
MNTSIRTAYRVAKKYQDNKDPLFIPQYQEEGNESWHNFTVKIKGRAGGHNTISFHSKSDAIDFLNLQWAKETIVVYYEDLMGERDENPL